MIPWGIHRHPVKPRAVTITLPALAVLMLVSTLLGAAATWAATRDRGVPQIVRGTVIAVNHDGTSIGFHPDDPEGSHQRDGEGEGLVLAGQLTWTDTDGSQHLNGVPPCLQPGSHGQRVELGIVELRQGSDSPPAWTRIVVWARCLSR